MTKCTWTNSLRYETITTARGMVRMGVLDSPFATDRELRNRPGLGSPHERRASAGGHQVIRLVQVRHETKCRTADA